MPFPAYLDIALQQAGTAAHTGPDLTGTRRAAHGAFDFSTEAPSRDNIRSAAHTARTMA